MKITRKKINLFLIESFIWCMLAVFIEVFVTATVERLSMGDSYVLISKPFSGYSNIFQLITGVSFYFGMRLMFILETKILSSYKWLYNSRLKMACFYAVLIYIIEYLSGIIINKVIGLNWWDYSQYKIGNIPLHLHGQITIVYLPFWIAAGFFVLPVSRFIKGISEDMSGKVIDFFGSEVVHILREVKKEVDSELNSKIK